MFGFGYGPNRATRKDQFMMRIEIERVAFKGRIMLYLVVNGEFKARTPFYNGDAQGADAAEFMALNMLGSLKALGVIQGGSGQKFGAGMLQ